ncbi:hypothetical protein D915_009076 [Fasciola hepatica]|uniref:Uncharacterized protein n=1 Tax=Fasciola hepatica TaxID=6192 RepID=A0A2H1BX74_FASHE|nr:hypothetical protein D915_009076 [Fasciola hepatica]
MCCCSADNVICCIPVNLARNDALKCDKPDLTKNDQISINNNYEPLQNTIKGQKEYELIMMDAEHFLHQVQPKSAIIQLELASRFLSSYAREPEKQVEFYVNYATAYEQLEEWPKAIKCLDKAISLLRAADSSLTKEKPELLAFLFIRLSLLRELKTTDFAQLFNSWFQGAILCAKINRTAQAEYCAWRATQWLIKTNLRKIDDQRISDAVCSIRALSSTNLKVIFLNGLGIFHLVNGLMRSATDFFKQAFDCLPPSPSRVKAMILQNIGTAHATMRRWGLAKLVLSRALEMHRLTGNHHGIAETASNIGYVAALCRNWSESRWNYVLAKQAARRVGFRHIADQAARAIKLIDHSQVPFGECGTVKFRSASISYYSGTDATLKDYRANSPRNVWSEPNSFVVPVASVHIPLR